ncbi:hypothetical protein COCNU_15G001050 [Cocos nucifera]|uniref:Uncharacterized protein n=1 Tax=Cocos nucifera TaxID=13894 RepID=A0A8K0IWN0_COCNU|nr:hypothetical protein COCNU_15G001050 [Cocos nucifera]
MSPKGTAYKVFTGGGMKFGQEKPSSPRAHPNSSEQEQQEVLPRRVSRERGMKFGSKKAELPPKAHHQGEMKFGTNKDGAKFPRGMKFGMRAEKSFLVE